MPKPNGYIFYRGPSMLDGKPIIAIATGFAKGSVNTKTGGDLIQTWIMRDDMSPTDAVNSGADVSICGDCQHRGTVSDGKNADRSCYVTTFQAPLNVWNSSRKNGVGIYPVATNLEELFAGRGVRLGAYGDPAAVPFHVWQSVMSRAAFGTGYTHQWRAFPELSAFCMASCDTPTERAHAKLMGFRTFRVRATEEAVQAKEVVCPASAEAGYKTTCSACRACGGTAAKARADIVIAAHGPASRVNAFNARIVA